MCVPPFPSQRVRCRSLRALADDYLVLAPGNAGGLGKPVGAPTLEARRAQFRSDAAKLEKASSVLIVGGGPVGIELAGEILTDFKSKKVLLALFSCIPSFSITASIACRAGDNCAQRLWLDGRCAAVYPLL